MGEPTETVVLEGGPWGDPNVRYSCVGRRLMLPDPTHDYNAAGDSRDIPRVVYADTGRRTADGRRVFAVEG